MYRTKTRQKCAGWAILKIFSGLVLVSILGGCMPGQPNSNAPISNSTANSAANTNANQNSTASETEAAANVPITLPVIDALLADESFVAEVKRSVQPSDEQLDKLKNAARDAVLQLSEGEIEDDRSTRASTSKAEKQVNEILGDANGSKFIALARRHWSGGDVTALAKPNSIPTDSRIVVNAPAYRMDVFRDGKLVKSYKVGIGYPEFPLPTGLRTAKTIIFNPPWTPPDEPWVKGEFQPGKKVEAGSKKNPLGVLKIPIGLPSLIHAGKDPSRLGTFASHGCVGLTNDLAQDFAAEIASISGTTITPQQVKEYEKTRSETSEVDLARPVSVELRYETIVAEDGKLHIYRDVYEHGTNTEENLIRVLQAHGLTMNDLTPDEQTKVREALEKMAIDARGKPVEEDEPKDKKPSTSDKVTRNIKGDKEIVIDIAALKGKGYPAPVDINS